jgi:hypothetical protein
MQRKLQMLSQAVDLNKLKTDEMTTGFDWYESQVESRTKFGHLYALLDEFKVVGKQINIMARQSGKTRMGVTAICDYIKNNEDSTILVVCPNSFLVDELRRLILDYMHTEAESFPLIINHSKARIEFYNGCKLHIKSVSSDVRGISFDFIYIDEMAFARGGNIFDSMYVSAEAKLLVNTSAGRRLDNRRLLEWMDRDDIKVNILPHDLCHIPNVDIDQRRATLSAPQFQMEYECKFVD